MEGWNIFCRNNIYRTYFVRFRQVIKLFNFFVKEIEIAKYSWKNNSLFQTPLIIFITRQLYNFLIYWLVYNIYIWTGLSTFWLLILTLNVKCLIFIYFFKFKIKVVFFLYLLFTVFINSARFIVMIDNSTWLKQKIVLNNHHFFKK